MDPAEGLPKFNDSGVLPEGIHHAHLEQFKDRLGFNRTRRRMIDQGLEPVLNELRQRGVKAVYVGGSFVTVNKKPADINIFVSTPSRRDRLFAFIARRKSKWKAKFSVSCTPAPEDETDFGSEEFIKKLYQHSWSDTPRESFSWNWEFTLEPSL